MRRLILLVLILISLCLTAKPGYAACTSPAGVEADIVYNADAHTYQFCNGTSWLPYKFGYAWQAQSNFNPTIAPSSGFFVLSHDTFDGNLGGLAGANAKCLTDLTTYTSWKGYATANSNGQLIGGKVKAFLCDDSTCNNLTASTAYYFANAGNSSAGGATFTTDGSGLGPNDLANWAAANYFGGMYRYWSDRATGTDTQFPGTSHGWSKACTNSWNSNGSGDTGQYGNSSRYGSGRWEFFGLGSDLPCNTSSHLICFVNP